MNLFERRVLEAFAKRSDPRVPDLSLQIGSVVVSKREETGVGWFTDFVADYQPASRFTGALTGISAGSAGSTAAVGFALFLTDGVIDCLECFSYQPNYQSNQEQYLVFED